VILRSVVGKLWLTIIILVSLVLILLSLFLKEQVEKTYIEDQVVSLQNLSKEIQTHLKTMGTNHVLFLTNVIKTAELFNTYIVVLDPTGRVGSSSNVFKVNWLNVLGADFKRVLNGKQVVKRGRFILKEDHFTPFFNQDILLVASPYYIQGKIHGVIILYQLQEQPAETDIKRWIFYSVLIGIFLTTIFAFFLSTRITQPLIQMKKATEKMTEGELSTRVPVRSHEKDEIADLAIAFNRMAKQLEDLINELSQEKEHLSSILRSMSDGVITLNKFGEVILINPPADYFLSLWKKKGEEDHLILPPPLVSLFHKVVEDHQDHTADITEQGRTWAVVLAPLYAKNEVRGVVAVLREVTEERRLDKLRKDFVANISHELRTPISMLQGYSEALMDDIADTPEQRREIAWVINEESLRMGRMVRELLDLARMEADHIQLNLSLISVPDFVERVVRKFQAYARDRLITLSTRISEHFFEVYLDKDKIEQVLTNLIDNAIRHTLENGFVTIYSYQDKKYQYLEVRDTGVGISEEDLPFIFERFYKADKARTRRRSGGTGLGLSIVKHLVHAHHGSISVKSQIGKGTVFRVQVPLQTKETEREGNRNLLK
jgi:two-component system, OmpR family, sensor histidine kinase ResE